jgi:hypothetical protein
VNAGMDVKRAANEYRENREDTGGSIEETEDNRTICFRCERGKLEGGGSGQVSPRRELKAK